MQPVEATSFLHIADIHFWKVVTNPLRLLNKRALGNANVWLRRGRQFRLDRAGEHADRALATGIREVVLTGDFTSTATDAEFAMARAFVDGLRARGMTVHLLPGNHDVYTFESVRGRRFERHFGDLLPGGGYPARVTLGGGVPLLLLPTVRPNWLSSRGAVRPETIATAEAWLNEAGGPVVAAGHYPLLHVTSAYASGPSHRLGGRKALRRALGASGRRVLYLCGHVHRDSLDADPEYPALTHLSTGAFLQENPRTGTLGHFTEVHLSAGGLRVVRHIRRPDDWTREETILT
jgi:3',5'-cyclic AMP phosphodiesterase CpdA